VDNVDLDRDRVELHLLRKTVAAGQPFLGICRGLQVINVGLGGTLYEDILDQKPGSLHHSTSDELPRNHLAHNVRVEPNSQLSKILADPEVQVNSSHHQGIRQLASDLIPTAYAPDGIIEAFELPGARYALAVQWHPEWLQEHLPMQALFRSFVEACSR
jgi:putative glutamine amidotransferase